MYIRSKRAFAPSVPARFAAGRQQTPSGSRSHSINKFQQEPSHISLINPTPFCAMRLALPPSWYPGPASGLSQNVPVHPAASPPPQPAIALLSISHRFVRFRCSLLVPSLLRSRRRRLHRYSLSPLSPERLNVGSVRERLLEVANAAGNVFVSLHRERDHGLWCGAVGLAPDSGARPRGRRPETEWGVEIGEPSELSRLTMKQNVNQGFDLTTDPE